MRAINRTNELRECLRTLPPSKNAVAKRSPSRDAFMDSALAILASINRLHTFLLKIRRAYLSTATASTNKRLKDASAQGLEFWENVATLTEAERDEIDFMVKVNLKKMLDSIKSLEHANRAFSDALIKQKGAGILKKLGLPQYSTATLDVLQAHRSAITLYLNNALTNISKEQKNQQEIRFKRQLDRKAHTLDLNNLSSKMAAEHKSSKSVSKDSIFTPAAFVSSNSDEPPIDSILSPAQIQQFESEQSALIQQTQSELASLKQAESSLLEISALQSELVLHLTQQAELTDKLWEDSMFVSGRVEEGNKQLKKAKERNRDSRIWLLVFLIGASLSLLFLDSF